MRCLTPLFMLGCGLVSHLLSLLTEMGKLATSPPTMPEAPVAGPAMPALRRVVAGPDHDALPRPPTGPERRSAGLRQEFGLRIAIATLVLIFNELFTFGDETGSVIRLTALIELGLNVPYLLAVRTGRALRAQAYFRMLVDVGLITAGLYGAGGLGAAQYIGIHAIVPVYTAMVFSSRACGLAVAFATVSYLAVVALQVTGVLPFIRPPLPEAWLIAAFNLLVLNIVGWLAAALAVRQWSAGRWSSPRSRGAWRPSRPSSFAATASPCRSTSRPRCRACRPRRFSSSRSWSTSWPMPRTSCGARRGAERSRSSARRRRRASPWRCVTPEAASCPRTCRTSSSRSIRPGPAPAASAWRSRLASSRAWAAGSPPRTAERVARYSASLCLPSCPIPRPPPDNPRVGRQFLDALLA